MANRNNSAQYNVNLAFTADVKAAKEQLESLQNQLTKLANFQYTDTLTKGISKELYSASQQAVQLKNSLEKATDVNTGKLNLTTFSNELTRTGQSLDNYRKVLQSLGPQGEEAFISLTQSIITADAALTTGSKKLNDFKKTLANTVKWQLSSNITHGIVGELQTAYYYAKDLDRALTDIKIVTEDSAGSMANFAEKANKAAQSLSTTTKDYAQASLIYYQQGLNDKEVEARTAVTIKMANAAGESASKVSDQLTAVWNNFYDGSKSLEYYADVMTKLGAYTASSTDEISEGIQKFASVANTIGLSYEYATSALATLTAKTRESANTVGNSLKTLFARIQGLTLGETLEDGTDLNKYSKALEKVGINIKDQQGELKDMNTILDEMMNKWDSLSRAEQVALAQTVGGVRQYTQLVNLMENKDYFKELVGVAENSEGTLTKQAEIYADSWEGARKRVQAAAEGIYDSLIDEEFFKDVDNITTFVLNSINTVIKSLGGVQGVVSNLGALFINLYKKEISQGLSNFGVMIQNLTPAGKAKVESRRQEALDAQKNMFTSLSKSQGISLSEDQARIQNYQTIYEFSQKIYDNAKNLTEEEKKQASQLLDILNSLGQQNIKAKEQLTLIKTANENSFSNLFFAIKSSDNGKNFSNETQDRILRNSQAVIDARVATQFIRQSGNTVKNAGLKTNEDLVNHLTLLKNKLNEVFNAQKKLNNGKLGLNDSGIKTNIENVDKLLNTVKKLNGKENINKNIETDANNLLSGKNGILNSSIKAIEEINTKFRTNLNQLTEGYGLDPTIINEVYSSMDQLTQAQFKSAVAAGNQTKAFEIFNNQLDTMANKLITTSQTIVAVANSLMSIASIANMVQGAIDTLSDPDASGWEKFLSILTTLGMLIPNVINLYNNLDLIIKKANQDRTQETLTIQANTDALRNNTNEQNINNTSRQQGVMGAQAGATALGGFSTALSWVTLGITAATVVASYLVKRQEELQKALEETAEKSKSTADALNNELSNNKELIESYKDILRSYKENGEGKEKLIEVGTQLIDLYDIENGSLLLLSGQYDKLTESIVKYHKEKAKEVIEKNEQAYDDAIKANQKTFKGNLDQGFWGPNEKSSFKYNTISPTENTKFLNRDFYQKYFEAQAVSGGQISDIVTVGLNTDLLKVNGEYDVDVIKSFLIELDTEIKDIQTMSDEYGIEINEKYLNTLKTIYNNTTETLNIIAENTEGITQGILEYATSDLLYGSTITNLKEYKNARDNLDYGTYNKPSDEEISSYLKNSDLGSYEIKLEALQQLIDASKAINKNIDLSIDDILNQYDDETIELLLAVPPEAIAACEKDLKNLISDLQANAKNNLINIKVKLSGLKEAKDALKKEMSSTDWNKFFEIEGIHWGSEGILSAAAFQNLNYNNQQNYLEQLTTEEYKHLQYASTAQGAQEAAAFNQDLINGYNAALKNPVILQNGQQLDFDSKGNLTNSIDVYDSIVDSEGRTWRDYKDYKQQIDKAINALDEDLTLAERDQAIEEIYSRSYTSKIGNHKGIKITGEEFLANYDSMEQQSNEVNILVEQRTQYLEDLKQAEYDLNATETNRINALREYNQIITDSLSSLSGIESGNLISNSTFEILKDLGIEMDKYFTDMGDGTYQLTNAAAEFLRVVGSKRVENVNNLQWDYQENIPDKEYSKWDIGESIANEGQNSKYYTIEPDKDIIQAAGINIEDYNGDIQKAYKDALDNIYSDYLNIVNERQATLNDATSVNDLQNRYQNTSYTQNEINSGKNLEEYQNGLLHMAEESGIGRSSQVTEARDAWADYNKIIQQYGSDSEQATKASERLTKAQKDLRKTLETVQFYDATEDLAGYIDEIDNAETNTEKLKAATKAAESLSQAFGKDIDDAFILDPENRKLIDLLLNGDASQKAEAKAKLKVKIDLEYPDENEIQESLNKGINQANSSEQGRTDAAEYVSGFQEVISQLQNTEQFKIEGKIDMDSTQAQAAVSGLMDKLSTSTGPAKVLAGVLNSILQTNMSLDSAQLERLMSFLTRLNDALNGDQRAMAWIATSGAQYLADAKINMSGTAPDDFGEGAVETKGPGDTGGGGGGGSSTKSANDIGKEIQDELLKTKEKKRDRLEALRDGANPEDSAKYIQEEIDLLEEEQDILEDQIKSWKKLLKLKVEEFNKEHPEFEIKLTDDGEIANASELWGKVWAQYQKNLEDGMSEEELNEWFTKIKEALDGPMGIQQNIDENVALIAQKEKEQAELELEAITKAIDWKVKQIDFQIKRLNYYQEKLLKQAHGNKQTIEAMLEGFAYQEQEMLQLFDKGATLRDGIDQLNAAKAKYPGYEQMFDEQILEYQSDLIDVNEAILDLRNDIEDLVQNVLDLALDEIDKQIERLDTYTSMLDHLNNIIDLSGRSMLDMGLKTQIGATKVETMLGKMKSLKAQMDGLTKATKEAEAALADRQADGDTSSVKFWENQVEVLKQETEKASEEFLASWEETLEAAQDLFEMRVEMAVAVLSNALSPFETLEDFQDKYEKAKTINEEYLDDAERLYELNKLNRQLNLQLADANDLLAKQKLRDIQQEIHDLQADGVQMSQYDLEYLQKKYDLQLAEIALMEQQNSKTSMRLVRDAAGNWTYAYDADEEKIEDATQKYEDAVHELGQLSKDYINDVSEQLIQNQIDFKEALQDLDKNSADYSNQLLALQEYYVERQRYLLDELNKGVENSGQTFHDTLYGQMTDLYDYNDAYMMFVNNSNTTISELQTNYKDWQKVVEAAMNVAGTSWDNFGTDMGGTLDSLEEHIQKLCDEIEELVNVLMGYISQSIGMVLDWEQKYSKRTDEELAKNEAYIDGNFVGSGGGGGGGYSDVDMRTDFTALLQRWDAGERNLTNYNGTKTYNDVNEILADLNAKLDAVEAGEQILYQGSGQEFSSGDTQDVVDKYGLRRNGGNYTTYSTSNAKSSITSNAYKYLGVPYVWGGTSSTGLDCSGLVYKALTDSGVDVPRTTAQGYKDMATAIGASNLKPGDLVFFGANGLVDHVGIYTGNGQMINATGARVQMTDINSKKAGLIGYGRIGNTLPSAESVIDKYGLRRNSGAASGAYTGDWGPGEGIGIDNGKIIKVHPKELILNKSDTRNILRAVDIVRNMNDWIDKQVQSMVDFGQAKLGSLIDKTIPPVYETQPIKQEVTIQADFPGVTDHYEIEEALSNLSNNAAQYISANKSK